MIDDGFAATPQGTAPGDGDGAAARSAEPTADEIPAGSDRAALAALARAKAAAAAKGLRPGGSGGFGFGTPRRRRPAGPTYSAAGQDARDPKVLGDRLDSLVSDQGWTLDVAAGGVMGRWTAIVGPEVAQHVTAETFNDGVLTVRADSSAWQTQTTLMSSRILGRIEEVVGPGVVASLRVNGPASPSWGHGPRRVRGPGPRDTYG